MTQVWVLAETRFAEKGGNSQNVLKSSYDLDYDSGTLSAESYLKTLGSLSR